MYKLAIIEDDTLMLDYFSSAYNWEEMGFELVASFSSSADFLTYLETNYVNAVITDIKMPNITGLELSKICSERFPDIGIILSSAYSKFEYAHEAFKYNVLDYVLKPIEDEALFIAMKKLKRYLDITHEAYENPPLPVSNPTIKKIYQYVDNHYSENININDVSYFAMINPNYFSFFFKKHTGEKFGTYLRRYRLQKACDLLINTDLIISAIAENVAYKNTSHFHKNFFTEYGMTPDEYRKKYKKT